MVARPSTDLLDAGEKWDADLGMQYLRARYYLPAQGVFNRLDPFFGNLDDPQSLHKYAYTHADPVNGIDPSGLFTLIGIMKTLTIWSGIGAISGGAISGIAARSAGLSWQQTFTSMRFGALYGGLAGFALGIASMQGRLQDVLVGAIIGGMAGMIIELLLISSEQIGNWVGPDYYFDGTEPSLYIPRVANEFVKQFAVSAFEDVSTYGIADRFGLDATDIIMIAMISTAVALITAYISSIMVGEPAGATNWVADLITTTLIAVLSGPSAAILAGGNSGRSLGNIVEAINNDPEIAEVIA